MVNGKISPNCSLCCGICFGPLKHKTHAYTRHKSIDFGVVRGGGDDVGLINVESMLCMLMKMCTKLYIHLCTNVTSLTLQNKFIYVFF